MRTCIAVNEIESAEQLVFIPALELYQRLGTVAEALHLAAKAPLGSGTASNPYVVNSFPTILGYIDKRNADPGGVMRFTFFGVEMYQNGNGVSEKQYYIGLKDEGTLSYPDMHKVVALAQADPLIKPEEVRNATGIGARSKQEMLAVACLFIGEGRRARSSLVAHLILGDLITDQVAYGKSGAKTRSLTTALDKPTRNFKDRYGMVAAGDSPMSQMGSVSHSTATAGSAARDEAPYNNRYFDKTVSLLAQWWANYYRSSSYELEACRPSDELTEAMKLNIRKQEDLIEARKAALEFSKNTKPFKKHQKRGEVEKRTRQELLALRNQILAELTAMLQLRLTQAVDGKGGKFSYTSTAKADTSVLKTALSLSLAS